MSNPKQVTVQVGPGISGLLLVMFVGLKLTNHIDWGWLWVLSPVWLPAAVLLAGCAVVLVFAAPVVLIASAIDARRSQKRAGIR